MPRPVCEAARSAAADSPCLGSGSATKTLARACIGRLCVVAGTARARWCSPCAVVCWAEALPVTAAEAGRALGPMLPASARERWPFCVLRDSCHAALPDQPGLPQNGSGRWTGGPRRRPRALRLTTDDRCVDTAGVWPCCVGAPLSDRAGRSQTPFGPQTARENARKTATAPVLMTGAWVRAPSIRRGGPPGALCASPRLARSLCREPHHWLWPQSRLAGRSGALSEVGSAGFPRCIRQLGASGWAEMHPIIAIEDIRALGPMLPSSPWERWRFFGRFEALRRVAPADHPRRLDARFAR